MQRLLRSPRRFFRMAKSSSSSSSSSSVSGSGRVVPPGFLEITEGTASMLYDEKEAVFYNKVQVLNRDLSIQVIRLFAEIRENEKQDKYQAKLAKFESASSSSSSSSSSGSSSEEPRKVPFPPPNGISILDALAATGLRSVRYLKEIPLVRHVTINDLEPAATAQAEANCEANGVEDMASRVSVHTGDACSFMYERREALDNFDVIDLDPYGTAAPFLDPAVQAVADGGLLCVTCTDMAVLSGNFPEKCFSLYGGVPLKNKYMHEQALRLLLHAIDTAANRHKKHIVPWLSLSVDFYVRVFVRVFENPKEVKRSMLKRMYVYQSSHCPSFYIQPFGSVNSSKRGDSDLFTAAHLTAPALCEETNARLRVGGPMWGSEIHSQEVVDELLRRVEAHASQPFPIATAPRLAGILTTLSEELKDCPLYYSLPELCATLQCRVPTAKDFHVALANAGYRASQFHHEPSALKTDAPPHVVWDIMRAWCAIVPPEGSKHKKQSSAGAAILANKSRTEVSFELPEGKVDEPKKKISRFPPNPEENWGPKRRAGRKEKKSKAGGGGGGSGGEGEEEAEAQGASTAVAGEGNEVEEEHQEKRMKK